jgi:hypothetical protein
MNRPNGVTWLLGNTGSVFVAVIGFAYWLYRYFGVGDATLVPVCGWAFAFGLAQYHNQFISDYLVFKQRQREIERQTGMTNPNLTMFEGYLEGTGATFLSLICFCLGIVLFGALGWFSGALEATGTTPDDLRAMGPSIGAGMALAAFAYAGWKLRKAAQALRLGDSAACLIIAALGVGVIWTTSKNPAPLETLAIATAALAIGLRLALMVGRIVWRAVGFGPAPAPKMPPMNAKGWPVVATATPARSVAGNRATGTGVRSDLPPHVRDMLIRERRRAEEERIDAIERAEAARIEALKRAANQRPANDGP